MKRIVLSLFALLAVNSAQAQAPSFDELSRRMIERRAVEAVIWGMPAVNTDLMRQQMLTKTDGKIGQVIYWGRPLDWHNQTLTPNPDTLYFMTFFDTKDGPIVLDFPPATSEGSLNGNIVNVWQAPLEDAGLLGVDKGKGVRLLLLPPGYSGKIPDGYEALQVGTHSGYALLRSNLASHSEADVAGSIAYGKKWKVYPLSQASNPPETVFHDVKDVLFDSTIRYDASFFENLNRIVQTEPWLDRDRVMIDQLKTLGIEKGKPFHPDEQTKAILDGAIKEAHALLAAKYDAGLPPFFSETSRWTAPIFPELAKAASAGFTEPSAYPVDTRGLTYTYGYIGIKRLGAGQYYLISIRDKDGDAFDGAKTYRLHVPADPPVGQYWSVTAYDRETHALIKNMPRASRASNAAEIKKNADGSVDLYLGPKAPAGQETNWIPTDAARKFELMFRAYGPKPEFFEKKWSLSDVEQVTRSGR
ncbi:MAG: DUF1254 domain-containing protein [Afipia felis]|nr:DUF1254 domain-containing protein [Afipia felis]